MELEFAKMHGAGNDFMVVSWPDGLGLPDAGTVRRWADRREGVGFDQLLLVQATEEHGLTAFYQVFNADGTQVEQCGNGVRCIARYLAPDEAEAALLLGSPSGTLEARLRADGEVSVNLGEPDFEPRALPFRAQEAIQYRLELDVGEVCFGAVSLGNPHAVIEVDSVRAAPVGILGSQLQSHQSFPEGVNVGFVEICDAARVRLRVFERGAGETSACGTGAAAAAAIGRLRGVLGDTVQVDVTGGTLWVDWRGPGHPLWLTGPATRVFEGRMEI